MTFLSAALAYAESGYRVFPLAPGTKVPPKGSRGLKDATSDAAQIEAWWIDTPDANIGLSTDGLVVIDVDNPTWPEDPSLAAELATGLVQKTPSGGRHYVFQQPAGPSYRNSASKIAPGVDVRASGGYIVVAPSVVDGKPYEWITAE